MNVKENNFYFLTYDGDIRVENSLVEFNGENHFLQLGSEVWLEPNWRVKKATLETLGFRVLDFNYHEI